MQCFDTFCGFLHKLYTVTMDGKGREGTHIFITTTGGGGAGEQGLGHPRHRASATHMSHVNQSLSRI